MSTQQPLHLFMHNHFLSSHQECDRGSVLLVYLSLHQLTSRHYQSFQVHLSEYQQIQSKFQQFLLHVLRFVLYFHPTFVLSIFFSNCHQSKPLIFSFTPLFEITQLSAEGWVELDVCTWVEKVNERISLAREVVREQLEKAVQKI